MVKATVQAENLVKNDSRKPVKGVQWRTLGLLFAALLVPMILFASIADEVHENDTLVVDTAILQYIHTFSSPTLDSVVKFLTNLGGVMGVGGITLAALGLFVWKKKYRAAVQLSIGIGGAVLLNIITKSLFMRGRPELWERIVTETSYSFPSGHSMASVALAASFVLIFWHTRYRWWVVGAAAVYTVMIGFTRMYLGVHYPSDVVAGWCLGVAWVVAVALVLRSITIKTPKK
jgi:undecaprenyl-diphosphatase